MPHSVRRLSHRWYCGCRKVSKIEAVEPTEVQDPNAEGNQRLPALEVERDGSDGEEAVLVVRGYGNDFLAMTQVANEVLLDDDRDEPAILFTTRYRIKPGASYVEIETTVQNVSFPPRELRWDQPHMVATSPPSVAPMSA